MLAPRAVFVLVLHAHADGVCTDVEDAVELVVAARELAARLDGADVKTLRDTVDQLKNKLGTSAVVLGATQGDKVLLIAGVSKDATARIKAGDLVNVAAVEVGGRGGGRPDMAQAGGSEPGKLDAALDAARTWLQNQLATEANA